MIKSKLLKQYLGIVLLDFPRYAKYLNGNHLDWIFLCNRIDELKSHPTGVGVLCNWQWSRSLHAPQLFPFLGKMLMARALKEFPVKFTESPLSNFVSGPDISFIIGHKGLERLPHLLQTLQSIAAQENINFECIVVEQSSQPEIKDYLPAWVSYVHDSYNNKAYNRSRTFNIGFSQAKGKLLILHDNDMAVPICYGRLLWERFMEGYEVINLKRFIFYLSQLSTKNIFERKTSLQHTKIDSIVQNLEAGGSIAIGREAYSLIGGFDEEFVGWGGEDLEFWERCLTRKVWNYTFLPIIHFWHYAQPEKNRHKNSTAMQRFKCISSRPPHQRISSLKSVNMNYFTCSINE